MSYHLYDFTESLRGGSGINHGDKPCVAPEAVEHVLAAWGYSPEGFSSWEGGFLLKLRDGRFAYLTGWCDTTGWGCQDGADITFFDAQPDLSTLVKPNPTQPDEEGSTAEWDLEPADLNKWIADGYPEDRT